MAHIKHGEQTYYTFDDSSKSFLDFIAEEAREGNICSNSINFAADFVKSICEIEKVDVSKEWYFVLDSMVTEIRRNIKMEYPLPVQEWFWRVFGICAARFATVTDIRANRVVARAISNFYSDLAFFDLLNNRSDFSDTDKAAILEALRDFWFDDKQTGFANIPEQYRAVALQGDFSGLIARKLAAAQAGKTLQKAAAHPMSKADKDVIARYLYTNYAGGGFATDEQSIYELVSKPRGFKAAATRIKELYDKQVCRHEKESGNRKDLLTWEKWLKMWGDAYGVTFPPYRFSQL